MSDDKQAYYDKKAYFDRVKQAALEEIAEEDFREAVEQYKTKLRQEKWWHRLVPFKVLIVRRESYV